LDKKFLTALNNRVNGKIAGGAILEIVVMDFMFLQKSMLFCPVINKHGLKAWFYASDDSLVDVAMGDFSRSAFYMKFFQLSVFYLGNSTFFMIHGIDKYLEAHRQVVPKLIIKEIEARLYPQSVITLNVNMKLSPASQTIFRSWGSKGRKASGVITFLVTGTLPCNPRLLRRGWGKLSETDTFLSGLRSTAERQNPRPSRRGASLSGLSGCPSRRVDGRSC
jgi:hypothetical protein